MDDLTKGTMRYGSKQIDDAPYTRETRGRVISSGLDGYTIDINGKQFTNVMVLNGIALSTNDIVIVIIPNNQTSNMYILGKLG